jgi:rhamnosyltransferase
LVNKILVSVVIRTLNEEKHLLELLSAIKMQDSSFYDIETIIIDSGSCDRTLEIAEEYGCRITHIDKSEFTFGRSLNKGCEFSKGKYLVFISGHCIPCDKNWINNLVKPLETECVYCYGRQLGRDTTKFSERQLLSKYFPKDSNIPQNGFFCNNANAAIRRTTWIEQPFNEELTGCEDMYLAKLLVEKGGGVGYVAEAGVYHIHDETWSKVKVRYEREAIALQQIMPQVHITWLDMICYISVGIAKDLKEALYQKCFFKEFKSITIFRLVQFYGAYSGNHVHRKLSHQMKMKYFYPRVSDMNVSSKYTDNSNRKS